MVTADVVPQASVALLISELTNTEDAGRIPDLLHPTPLARLPQHELKVSLTLAFAGGVSGGMFHDALARASVAPSDWEPASFANDLFLQNFVARCFQLRIDSRSLPPNAPHLVRLLSHPPADPAIVDFRRAVIGELMASRELRGELEQLYMSLIRFRALLEGATGVGKWDANRRKLDLLRLVRDIIDKLASGFSGARSGLSRLAVFGLRVQGAEPYKSLCDLLHYDEHLATLNLRVGVGADGRIRGFEIRAVQENSENPFVNSALRRWLAKVELFVRGFAFGEGEVMARLIDGVFEGVEDDIVHFVQLTGDIEFYLGALSFGDLARDAGLEVCLPELVDRHSPRQLEGLFNPLLLSVEKRVVPCNLSFDRHDTTVLVTGPNSGGKTRLLQSLGLTQVLAQSGLIVPARRASLALAKGLLVSLIQETSADQAEGRLGMELMRIRALFERLPPGAMVILDELCSGTNPSEGEEIFELVIHMLARLEPQVFITTHFLSFASRLEREKHIPALRFLQVELGEEQEPTYQFVPGVASTSLAGQTAARLGVTSAQLLELIERNLSKAGKG